MQESAKAQVRRNMKPKTVSVSDGADDLEGIEGDARAG